MQKVLPRVTWQDAKPSPSITFTDLEKREKAGWTTKEPIGLRKDQDTLVLFWL